MELRYKISSRILLVAMMGAIMVCASYLTFVYHPVSLIIKKLLTLSPGSLMFYLWSRPPYDVYIKVTIFNVTNPDKFYSGEEQLHVNEIGPYIYKETLQNADAQFNENGTITFVQKRGLEFVPELSVGDPHVDWLISPNIPLVGITASLQDSSMFVNMAVSTISQYLGSKPFVNLTVDEYLWGYDDPLVKLANNVIPSWINFPRFGILDRLMALDNANNTVLMNMGSTTNTSLNPILTEEERTMDYSIQRWNGSPGLSQWGYVEPENGNETLDSNSMCNLVEGAFEGGIYPPNVNKVNGTFRLYRRAFCRPVKFGYEKEIIYGGFKGNQFRVDRKFLGTPEENPDNSCYCVNGVCPPSGLGFIGPCYYDIPVTISQPHFYNADPKIQGQVLGMKPNKTKHDSYLILHQEMGAVLKADLKIQINLFVNETRYNSKTKPFNGLTLPLFFLEMSIEKVPPTVGILMVLVFDVLPVVQEVLVYLLAIVGVLMVSGSALALLIAPRTDSDGGANYSPIPIIPMASQYFKPEIRICK